VQVLVVRPSWHCTSPSSVHTGVTLRLLACVLPRQPLTLHLPACSAVLELGRRVTGRLLCVHLRIVGLRAL
jgi:hypothetical protein